MVAIFQDGRLSYLMFSVKIIHFDIKAWNLSEVLSESHCFGKQALATQTFNMVAIFKMADIE